MLAIEASNLGKLKVSLCWEIFQAVNLLKDQHLFLDQFYGVISRMRV